MGPVRNGRHSKFSFDNTWNDQSVPFWWIRKVAMRSAVNNNRVSLSKFKPSTYWTEQEGNPARSFPEYLLGIAPREELRSPTTNSNMSLFASMTSNAGGELSREIVWQSKQTPKSMQDYCDRPDFIRTFSGGAISIDDGRNGLKCLTDSSKRYDVNIPEFASFSG